MSEDLVIGTVQFGLAYGIAGRGRAVEPKEARAILDAGYEAGVRRLDTAPGYGDIEERLADLSAGLDMTFTSKIPAVPQDLRADAARAWIEASLTTSRRRLGDRLTRVLFHRSDDLDGPLGSALWNAAANLCASAGLELGISSYSPGAAWRLAARYPIAAVQLPGNAFDQRLAKEPLGDLAVDIRSVFLQGLLTGPADAMAARLPDAADPLARWHTWCAEHRLSPLEAAIRIARGLRPGSGFVFGVETHGQLVEIVEAWQRGGPIQAPELSVTDDRVIRPDLWRTTS